MVRKYCIPKPRNSAGIDSQVFLKCSSVMKSLKGQMRTVSKYQLNGISGSVIVSPYIKCNFAHLGDGICVHEQFRAYLRHKKVKLHISVQHGSWSRGLLQYVLSSSCSPRC